MPSKTTPAFEAALLAGIRLAGPVEPYREPVVRFARHVGVAYQIVNDLDDWKAHDRNKRQSGSDLLSGRPTVLWALALENLSENDGRELEDLLDDRRPDHRGWPGPPSCTRGPTCSVRPPR